MLYIYLLDLDLDLFSQIWTQLRVTGIDSINSIDTLVDFGSNPLWGWGSKHDGVAGTCAETWNNSSNNDLKKSCNWSFKWLKQREASKTVPNCNNVGMVRYPARYSVPVSATIPYGLGLSPVMMVHSEIDHLCCPLCFMRFPAGIFEQVLKDKAMGNCAATMDSMNSVVFKSHYFDLSRLHVYRIVP